MPPKLRSIVFYALLLLLFGVTAFLLTDFVNKSLVAVRQWSSVYGDHDRMRSAKIPYFRAVEEAASMMESSPGVMLPSSLRTIDRIAVAYAVYPATVREDGGYLLDVNKSVRNVPADWNVRRLTNGIALYAKPGQTFREARPAERSRGTEAVMFLFVLLFMTFSGINVLKAIGVGPRLLGGWWFWSTGYLTGLVITGAIFWLMLMAGVSLDWVVTAGTLGCVFAVSLIAGGMKTSVIRDEADAAAPRRSPAADLLTVSVVGLALLTTLAVPVTNWDEMLIWVMKAKMLFYDGTLDFSHMSVTHVYYPLLWPLHLHTFAKLAGACSSELIKLVSASVFLAFAGQLNGACRSIGFDAARSSAFTGFYLILFMGLIFFTALPENIFYALSLGTAVCLAMWLRGREARFMILAWLLAVGLSAVKFEGGLLVWAMALACAIAGRSTGMSLGSLLPVAGLLLAGAVPLVWIEWLKGHGYAYRIYHLDRPFAVENLGAIYDVLAMYWSQGTNLLLLVLLPAVYVFAPVRRRAGASMRLFGGTALFLVLFSVGSVVCWPLKDIQMYYPEVLHRLFLRAAPFILLFWAAKVFDRSAADPTSPKAGVS